MTVEAMRDGLEGETVASRLDVVEVGQDSEGALITSCVVVPCDITGESPRGRVKGRWKIALELLCRAVIDAGEEPPSSNHIPPNIAAVRLDLWRRYCYEGQITSTNTPKLDKNRSLAPLKNFNPLEQLGNGVSGYGLRDAAGPDITRTCPARPATPDRTDTTTPLRVSSRPVSG